VALQQQFPGLQDGLGSRDAKNFVGHGDILYSKLSSVCQSRIGCCNVRAWNGHAIVAERHWTARRLFVPRVGRRKFGSRWSSRPHSRSHPIALPMGQRMLRHLILVHPRDLPFNLPSSFSGAAFCLLLCPWDLWLAWPVFLIRSWGGWRLPVQSSWEFFVINASLVRFPQERERGWAP